MSADSTSERVSDADVVRGIKVIDVDTHISEPLDEEPAAQQRTGTGSGRARPRGT